MHGPRRAIVQRLMDALIVVKWKIVGQTLTRLGHIPIVLEINFLVLHAPPQSFHEDVVEGAPAPIHAQPHLGLHQRCLELRAGELHPLVGVEDLRALAGQRPMPLGFFATN